MIQRSDSELVTQPDWLSQRGVEVCPNGRRYAKAHCHVPPRRIPRFHLPALQRSVSWLPHRSRPHPKRLVIFQSEIDHSIPIGRPVVQRFSPIHF
jgi:hypothetical protein